MWIPLTIAAVGALLLVGGIFICVQRADKAIFSDEPIDMVERLGLYAMVVGFAAIVAANVLTYFGGN